MPARTAPEARFNPQFKAFAAHLDAINEKRERLVKASRDVTYASKKAIFELHRLNPSNRSTLLRASTETLASIRATIASRIAAELDPATAPRFRRAYSPALQEYVEARTFLHFLASASLAPHSLIQAELSAACDAHNHAPTLLLGHADYVLGVADLTGELMRRAVAAAARADVHALHAIWRFLTAVERGLRGLEMWRSDIGREFVPKMKVLRASVEKVEKSCFDLAVRRAEFPDKANAVPTRLDAGAQVKRRRVA